MDTDATPGNPAATNPTTSNTAATAPDAMDTDTTPGNSAATNPTTSNAAGAAAAPNAMGMDATSATNEATTSANPSANTTTSNPNPFNGGQAAPGSSTTPPTRKKVTWAEIKARQGRQQKRTRPLLSSRPVVNGKADRQNVEQGGENEGEEEEEEEEEEPRGVRFGAADFQNAVAEAVGIVIKKRGLSQLFKDDDEEVISPRKRTGKVSDELQQEKARDKRWERKALCVSNFLASFHPMEADVHVGSCS